MAGRDFEIRIIGDSSKAVRAAEQFGNKLDDVFGDGKKRASSFSDVLKGSFIGTFLGNAGAKLVSGAMGLINNSLDGAIARVDTMNAFPKVMQNLGYSSEEAATSIQTMSKRLQGLPTSLDAMTGMVQQLAPLTGGLGKATELSLALNNALLAGGKSTDLQRNAMEQYTQMLSIGKVDMAAWRSMVTAMPGQMDQLSQSLLGAGKKSMDLYNAMKDGTVTFDQFNSAVLKLNADGVNGFASFETQARSSTDGIATAQQNLHTAVTRGVAGVINQLRPMITGALGWSTAAINGFFGWFSGALAGVLALLTKGDFTAAFRTAFHVEEDSTVVRMLVKARSVIIAFATQVPQIVGKIGTALAPIGQGLTAVFAALGDSARTVLPMLSPIGIATGVISEAMPALSTAIGSALTGIAPTLPALAASIGQMVAVVGRLVSALAPLVGGVLLGTAQAVAAIAPPVIEVVTAVLGWIVANKSWLAALGVAAGIIGGVVGAIYLFKAAQLAIAAATYGAQGAMVVAGVSAKIYGVIMKAQAIGVGIVTAAQWAWNAALTANPIGVIIVAIAALVGALVWFFTQTDLGRQIWETVTTAIGAAVTWLWTNVLQPVFTAIGVIFTWIYENIIRPIVLGIMIYIGIWAAVITWLWNNVLSPVFAAIGAVFVWVYENVISPVVSYIQSAILGWAIIMQWLNQNVVQPTVRALGSAFLWIWSNIISPVASFIGNAITGVGNTVQSVFGGIAGFIGAAFQNALAVVRGPINGIIGLVNNAIRALNSVSVTVPSWVPVVGGQTFGLSIPTVPYLASGTVTNGPLLAMIGDNPGGREVVSPLDTYQAELRRAYTAGQSSTPAQSGPVRLDSESIRALGRVIIAGINRGGTLAVLDSIR